MVTRRSRRKLKKPVGVVEAGGSLQVQGQPEIRRDPRLKTKKTKEYVKPPGLWQEARRAREQS